VIRAEVRRQCVASISFKGNRQFMKRLFAIWSTVIAVVTIPAFAQDRPLMASVSVDVIPVTGLFLYGTNALEPSRAGFYVQGYLNYQMFSHESLTASLSAEGGYAAIQTVQIGLLVSDPPKIETYQSFILAGIELSTSSVISPFLRARVGISKVTISPDSASFFSLSGQSWAFALALGGGVRYKMTQSIAVSITADYLGSLKENIHVYAGDGRPDGLAGPVGTFPIGLSIGYFF